MPTKGQLIAEGTYVTARGAETVERETWQLSQIAHGVMLFTNRAETSQPQARTWSFTYEITPNWDPVSVTIRVDADGKTTTSEQRAEGARYTAHIEPRGETARDLALDFGAQHQLIFPSPVFIAVALVRLNLQVGQSRDADGVEITLPTLEPRAVKAHYECTAEEKVAVPSGEFSTWHYTRRAQDAETASDYWADRHGIVLQARSADGSETKLTHYRRIERR